MSTEVEKDLIAPSINRETAIKLLKEALSRLEFPSKNANGGAIQMGGVYWRLARVLGSYADPNLDKYEANAKRLREGHGVLSEYQEPTEQLHYFAFSFDSGAMSASVYLGYPEQIVSIARIKSAKEAADMPPNSVLIGLAYMGLMSRETARTLS